MIKNIIIGVLIVASFFSLIYAFFQQTAANKAQIVAEQNLILAVKSRKDADIQVALAVIARMDAETQRKIAEDCKKRK